MADLDLRPERRALLAAGLRDVLTIAIPGSHAGLRGSLATGTADRYSDIDLCWVVPDDRFAAAVDSAAKAIRPLRAVSSLRIDPGLARSDRRRLVFSVWRACRFSGESTSTSAPLQWHQMTTTTPPTRPLVTKQDGLGQLALRIQADR